MIEKNTPENAIKDRLIKEALDFFNKSELTPNATIYILFMGYIAFLENLEEIKVDRKHCKDLDNDIKAVLELEQKVQRVLAIVAEFDIEEH